MTLILTILKCIGFILLIILAILLAVILMVLFVPIRYRLDGEFHQKLKIEANVTWFLRLLSVDVSYAETLFYSVKVAGFTIFPKIIRSSEEDNTYTKEESAKDVKETKSETADVRSLNETVQNADTFEQSSEKASLSEKSEKKKDDIQNKFDSLADKISEIKKKVLHYFDIIWQDTTKIALMHTLGQIFKIIKHIIPSYIDVYFEIGTGDPASTGQILAIQGVLYPILYNRVCIVPDFEEKRVDGEFHIKGKIIIITLLICAVRVILKKEIRKLIKRLLKKEEA